MTRKPTILLLILAWMTALLAPARFGFACLPTSQVSRCPMMAARRSATKAPCCMAKEAASKDPSLSTRCCCNLQSAPEAPALPEAILSAEPILFLLEVPTLCISAPETTCIACRAIALETTAPRGPPLPFSSLRAPPSFS